MTEQKNKIEYVKDTFPEYLNKKDYIAASDIKRFLKSPSVFYFDKFLKKEKSDERHFSIGSALHELILEPDLFNTNYVVAPKFDKRTKEGKARFEEFTLNSKGKTVLFEDEMEMVVKMSQNALLNHTLLELMQNSHRELSCYTIDEKTGLKIKMRPDIMSQTKSTITDIKSCVDSSPKKFKNDVYSYGYSISAAFYCDNLKRENYVFAAMEKQEPYQVSLFTLNDEMIEYGRSQYRMALDLIKWSFDNNYWCNYNEFEILKECYALENLNEFMNLRDNSQLITIL